MSLHTIREAKASKTAEARALLADNRDLTAEEAAKFDGLKKEIEALESQEARAQFLDEAERRQSGTVITGGDNFADVESRVSLLSVLQAGMEGRALNGAEALAFAQRARAFVRRSGHPGQGHVRFRKVADVGECFVENGERAALVLNPAHDPPRLDDRGCFVGRGGDAGAQRRGHTFDPAGRCRQRQRRLTRFEIGGIDVGPELCRI